ncbi:MAG: hypothetical protein M1823_005761 [Watsoniomyces obsoletus]|nr:MAG: hypothetical protein M1823_005761 [Watsoniomyces obsoletus]
MSQLPINDSITYLQTRLLRPYAQSLLHQWGNGNRLARLSETTSIASGAWSYGYEILLDEHADNAPTEMALSHQHTRALGFMNPKSGGKDLEARRNQSSIFSFSISSIEQPPGDVCPSVPSDRSGMMQWSYVHIAFLVSSVALVHSNPTNTPKPPPGSPESLTAYLRLVKDRLCEWCLDWCYSGVQTPQPWGPEFYNDLAPQDDFTSLLLDPYMTGPAASRDCIDICNQVLLFTLHWQNSRWLLFNKKLNDDPLFGQSLGIVENVYEHENCGGPSGGGAPQNPDSPPEDELSLSLEKQFQRVAQKRKVGTGGAAVAGEPADPNGKPRELVPAGQLMRSKRASGQNCQGILNKVRSGVLGIVASGPDQAYQISSFGKQAAAHCTTGSSVNLQGLNFQQWRLPTHINLPKGMPYLKTSPIRPVLALP